MFFEMAENLIYRAWDYEEKKMHQHVNPIFSNKGNLDFLILEYSQTGYDLGELEIIKCESASFSTNGEIPYVLMAYAGIPDKNGKRIYQGDFLRTKKGNLQLVKLEVLLVNGSYSNRFYCSSGGKAWLFSDTDEVVGNIYENPELVEEYNKQVTER